MFLHVSSVFIADRTSSGEMRHCSAWFVQVVYEAYKMEAYCLMDDRWRPDPDLPRRLYDAPSLTAAG